MTITFVAQAQSRSACRRVSTPSSNCGRPTHDVDNVLEPIGPKEDNIHPEAERADREARVRQRHVDRHPHTAERAVSGKRSKLTGGLCCGTVDHRNTREP
ncbi:hypothetical protein [Gemmatimonas sp.]|uniref:hypothetical protein n=1 Tax=Gemmatimonas sp. TaxID=1962908 RepID=UPI00356AE13F